MKTPRCRLFLLTLLVAAGAHAHPTAHELATGVDFAPARSARIPLDTPLVDAAGRSVRLREFARERPLLVVPVYFECGDLCPLTLDALANAVRTLDVVAGRDFDVVAFSIDPAETPAEALRVRDALASRHARPGDLRMMSGWHFVTGTPDAIERITTAAGLRYLRDGESGRLAHPSGVLVLTKDGSISGYLAGVDFPAGELRDAIVEAAQGRTRTLTERIWLLCHAFDPQTGRYSAITLAAVRSLALAGALALGVWLARMTVAVRRKPGRASARAADGR